MLVGQWVRFAALTDPAYKQIYTIGIALYRVHYRVHVIIRVTELQIKKLCH